MSPAGVATMLGAEAQRTRLHVMCERDVGLFSLVQQVIANIPWALGQGRVPIAYFRDRTCYWVPTGHRGGDTVWEYYFEPVVATHPVAAIPAGVVSLISRNPPGPFDLGYEADERTFVTAHFGDHPALPGMALPIPYLREDPSDALRWRAAAVIRDFIRPRHYIRQIVEAFFRAHMAGVRVIGVHVRGTDAVSPAEVRPHRLGSLRMARYVAEIERLLRHEPDARILVATDSEASLDQMRAAFGDRVIAYDALRHQGGEAAGVGPTGWIMPAYVAEDRQRAARNGEDAVVEYLLLTRCDHLVHNGSSLARTVLLAVPQLEHTNTHVSDGPTGDPGGPAPTSPSPAPMAGTTVTVDDALVERVKRDKARRRSSPVQYRDRVRVAFVVHSFNRAANVDQIVTGLRRVEGHELLVCDDGSVDASRERWMSHLTSPNDFLILSNDLHEIRILDRAIRFASADVICLVQDDDVIPHDTDWLDRALDEFRRHPRLAILGGFMGFHGFEPRPDGARCIWGEAPFQFVEHANIGPYFVRKLYYEDLGGWDLSFSRVGEPGICFDNELCLRAWVEGYKVGYRFVPFKGQPGSYAPQGGTMLFSPDVRLRNQWQNQRKIWALHGPRAREISELVRRANEELGGRPGRGAPAADDSAMAAGEEG